MRIPRKLKIGSTPFATEWNVMVDYLRSVTQSPSAAGSMVHTPFGTVRSGGRGGSAAAGTTEVTLCNPDTGESELWRISGTRLS